jgi:hypothetical protein
MTKNEKSAQTVRRDERISRDLGLESKATVMRDLGSGNHLIDGVILEICKID